MPSFDVVNKLEMPEVQNAAEQARKEIIGRYDFKGTNTLLEVDEKKKEITIRSNSADRVAAAYDVLMGRLMKRNISPKVLESLANEELPGGTVKRIIKLKDGLDDVNSKKVVALIKENFPKTASASINANLVRVSSKSRDSLQDVIQFLRGQDLPVPLQFTNPRD